MLELEGSTVEGVVDGTGDVVELGVGVVVLARDTF